MFYACHHLAIIARCMQNIAIKFAQIELISVDEGVLYPAFIHLWCFFNDSHSLETLIDGYNVKYFCMFRCCSIIPLLAFSVDWFPVGRKWNCINS